MRPSWFYVISGLMVFEKMSQKRQQDDDGGGCSKGSNNGHEDKRRRRIPSFGNVVLEMMRMRSVQHILEPMLETVIRRVVKEEVELALRKHVINFKRNSGDDAFPAESRHLQLKFLNTISLPVFTGTRIEGEDGSAIRVALVDAISEEVVSFGPESSAKVEIVVLEGDFDSDEGESWTPEEFRSNIVREREGKKPLLTGDIYLNLKDGVGFVGEISFTDNSSWTRSRKFRLGAKMVGNFDGIKVKEAKTESFIVRDHRGELYKKHHPPSLCDEVWRLEKIGKDGAFHKRLSRDRVYTVKDFLILLHLDHARLRNILGNGMSAKMWEVTVEHARTCVLDKKVYLYYPPRSEPRNGVVFNVVGQLMGLFSESRYVPVDKLSETDKLNAQRSIIEAFQHPDGVIPYDDENSLLGASSRTEPSDGSKILTSHNLDALEYQQPSVSSPDIISSLYSIGCMSSSDDYPLHPSDTLDFRYDLPLSLSAEVSNSLLCDTESMTRAFHDDKHLSFLDPVCPDPSQNPGFESEIDLHSMYSSFLLPTSASLTCRGGAQRRWKKIFSVLQWFLVRRIVVKRTRSKAVQRFY